MKQRFWQGKNYAQEGDSPCLLPTFATCLRPAPLLILTPPNCWKYS
jgi:hypothetical protein